MTCIVGLELPGGRVMLGADSAASFNDCVTFVTTPKVARHGSMLLGCAGSIQLCEQVTLHSTIPKPPPLGASMAKWVTGKLMADINASVRKVLRTPPDGEDRDVVHVLLGVNGEVWWLDPIERWAIRSQRGFSAIGNGAEVAVGSLYTTAQAEGLMPDPRDRIEMSIRAASSRCLGVGGPIVILEGKAVSGRSKPHGNPKADSRGVRGAKATPARKKPRVR